tara:strand:- start:205 stop:333 length:129 start_codon:yes stop_codon:yes gene_type:complete
MALIEDTNRIYIEAEFIQAIAITPAFNENKCLAKARLTDFTA